MSDPFAVRRATPADAALVARHRIEMFRDMGQLPAALDRELTERTIAYLKDAIPTGEYIGWLASTHAGGEVVAGAGVQLRRMLPRPLTDAREDRVAIGREAVVLNVFTEAAWRRRGLARLLMDHVLAWAREADVDRLVLQASDAGRVLYEQIGFVPTSEMRYARPLR